MLDIKKMNEIVQPEIKRLFNNFFEDKYNEEVRETILEDLINLIRNDLIEEIYFCLFDSAAEKIIAGYSLKIVTNQTSNYLLPKNYEPIKKKLSTSTEKFLIIKLSEDGIKESTKSDSKLNELTNKWDFLKQPDIKMKAEKEQLLWIEDTKIEMQEIING